MFATLGVKVNDFQAQWFEMECIFGGAIRREQNVDLRKNVNWEELEQIALGGAVASGCALLERAGLKGSDMHIKTIFELRNSFVHNNCDISKNNNKGAYCGAKRYLEAKEYLGLSSEFSSPFFNLEGSNVVFNRSVLFAIKLCFEST